MAACFSRNMAIITYTNMYCTYINVHIYCGLNALSLIFALFLFVLLLKYNILVVIVSSS